MEAELISRIDALHLSGTSQVAYFNSTPSSSEFAKFVAENRPVVIRGQGPRLGIPSASWTNEYIAEKLKGKELSIAVSPAGNADSIVDDLFVEPAAVKLEFERFLNQLGTASPVHYLQSQNGNMSADDGECAALLDDVGREVPEFARQAFRGGQPDAVNLWIGDQYSVTSLHKDPYENIYLVVRGSKEFTLLPPIEYYCLHEQLYEHTCYVFNSVQRTFSLRSTASHAGSTVPWIPVDPVNPDLERYPRFRHAHPQTVRLEAGDMLYLPALWFHRVAQDVGPSPGFAAREEANLERIQCAISVNWWCDMDYEKPLWDDFCQVRRMTLLLDGRQAELDEEESGSDQGESL